MTTTITQDHVNARAERLVRGEVILCVSSLVSTIGQSCAAIEHSESSSDMEAIAHQAMELSMPVDDWEEPLINAGCSFADGKWFHPDGTEMHAATAQELCEFEGLDPYQWEIFEHWVVSDWLAGKLAERGERVGEFGPHMVWGRSTTGQGIAMDSVILTIARECLEG